MNMLCTKCKIHLSEMADEIIDDGYEITFCDRCENEIDVYYMENDLDGSLESFRASVIVSEYRAIREGVKKLFSSKKFNEMLKKALGEQD